jgi:hypothetical protein
MEDFVLQRLNVSEAIATPGDTDGFPFVVSHAFTLRFSIGCGRGKRSYTPHSGDPLGHK